MTRQTYTVRTVRNGRWCAIRVAELPSIYSQASIGHQVESMARDAIALYLDVKPDSFDIVVEQTAESERSIEA